MPLFSIISLFLIWASMIGGFTAALVSKENNAYIVAATQNISAGNTSKGIAVNNAPQFLQEAMASKDKLYLQMGVAGGATFTQGGLANNLVGGLPSGLNQQTASLNKADGNTTISSLFKKILAIDKTQVAKPVTAASSKYLLANVATHNKESDCWIVVNSKVYDVAGYIAMHPGGKSTIVNQCGKDATAVFTSRGGTGAHSTSAWSLLDTFLTGTLTTALPLASIDGICGISQGMTSSFAPSVGLCTSGKATTVITANSLYTWDCSGTNGGKVASCSAMVGTPVVASSSFVLADLAQHATEADCWIAVNSKVYSVSSYIAMHPGGKSTIVNQCGKDATAVFTSRGGTGAHSTSAWSLLNGFLMGTLTDALPLAPANGTCGAATLIGTASAPTTSLCSAGTASTVTSDATGFSWSCSGANGGTAATCSATKTTAIPTGKYSTATVATHSTASDCWIIVNSNVYSVSTYMSMHPGGAAVISAQCGHDATAVFTSRGGTGAHSTSAWALLDGLLVGTLTTALPLTPINGTCGAATLIGTASAPTTSLCSAGTASTVTTGATSHTWTCSASNGGTPANCSASKTTTPVTPPTTSYSSTVVATHNTQANCWFIVNTTVYDVTAYISMHPGGTAVIVAQCGKDATVAFSTKSGMGTGSHSAGAWTLLNGLAVGTLAASTNPLAINGTCGTANAVARATAPTTGLCTAGTASTITGTGPWNWSCAGTLGGATAACSATSNAPVAGVCGISNGMTASFAPATGLCTTGTASTVTTGATAYTWTCTGLNAGPTASCSTTIGTPSSLTAAVIATHNTPTDCYIVVGTNVYSVGPYINLHPGGAALISNLCGQDATVAFNTKGGVGVTPTHSAAANTTLGTFLIGPLSGPAPTPPTTPVVPVVTTYTATQIGTHSTPSDCWIVVGTNVYSVGAYLAMHPGGSYAISKYCGKDATTAFGNRGGTGTHTAAAQTMLGGFKVGTLSGTAPASTPVNAAPTTAYNLATIATHSLSTDCWIIVNTNVYSVAPYVSLHPGGVTRITNLCGKDATAAFNGQGHSATAKSTLGGLMIGVYSATAPTPTPTPVNGACGTANGVAVGVAPTTGLCTAGTAGTVSGAGPFTWSCTGTNGGTTASCTAPLSTTTGGGTTTPPTPTPVNGACGTANGTSVSTAPTTGLCTTGTADTVAGTGPWTWNCLGSSGGTTAACTATMSAPAPTPQTYTVSMGNAGSGLTSSGMALNAGDKVIFNYTAGTGEAKVAISPAGASPASFTLDKDIKTKTVTFSTTGTYTFKVQ